LQARQTSHTALRKTLRDNLDVILAKALKKSPQERYATVAMLADDLRRHLAQQPISARADSGWYRTRLFVTRNRVAVVASSLAAVALIGTAGVATWQAKVSAKNADLANKAAANAHAVQTILAGMLSKADPEHNKDITALDRQLIDQTLAEADRVFAGSPRTSVLVLKQLGDIYFRLGLPDKFLEVQRKRTALLEAMPEVGANERVDAQLLLGQALSRSTTRAETSQALAVLVSARDAALSLRAEPTIVVRAHCLLADQLLDEARYAEADALADQAVRYAERGLTAADQHLAWAYEQKAATATRLGDFDSARRAHRQALAVDAKAQGSERGRSHVDRLSSRSNMVRTEFLAGRYLAAKQEALAALEFARLQLGATEDTLTPIRIRAVMSAVRAGQVEEAAQMAQRLLAPDLASEAPFRVGRAQLTLGLVAVAQGQHAAASQAFVKAEAGLLPNLPWRNLLALEQASLTLRQDRTDEALKLFRPLLDRVRVELGDSSEEFAFTGQRTAVALMRQGKTQDARGLLAQACRWTQVTLNAAHPNRLRCDAYATLMSEDATAEEKQHALLSQWNGLKSDGDNPLALTASLQAAAAWSAKPPPTGNRFQDFPLLD
jgi:eukaryotic-like serine/threonine-protein kinase